MKINWFEIPVSDIDRAQAFYETIFDIKMERLQLGDTFNMALFPTPDGSTKGGALCQHPTAYTPSDQGTVIYLDANPSVAVIVDRIAAAGGEVVVPRTQINEERGYMALFKDTEGNRVALQGDD